MTASQLLPVTVFITREIVNSVLKESSDRISHGQMFRPVKLLHITGCCDQITCHLVYCLTWTNCTDLLQYAHIICATWKGGTHQSWNRPGIYLIADDHDDDDGGKQTNLFFVPFSSSPLPKIKMLYGSLWPAKGLRFIKNPGCSTCNWYRLLLSQKTTTVHIITVLLPYNSHSKYMSLPSTSLVTKS
jgi:hypothetical protein